ncbi:transmembrane protein 156 isoform X8 [Mus musculus]|uniref:transmembrane protein 156 isoform X8 n=1 Tax=Mus musculus TaxID=10090 RepID=UPI0003D70F9B|nr:transmembrane protein 156 isoform X8 [Mus musculus]|eukprot:XP_017176704.1 PREDICTED: transmembrane protein 156 isoform X6 [Mus musculus]
MRSRKQHTIKLPMGTHLCHSTLSASGDRRDLLGCMQHELKFERTRELSCLEVCFLPNFTSPLSSFNFSSVAFLQPAEEIQTIMGISPNHSSFQSFAEICRGITSRLPMCSLCLVCESKGDVDFTSQEQTSKGLVMRGSMEVTASDLSSPCQYFNITAALIADPVKEDNTTCTPETRPGKASAVDEDLARKKSLNHTCRFMKSTNNCAHIFLRLETDVKPNIDIEGAASPNVPSHESLGIFSIQTACTSLYLADQDLILHLSGHPSRSAGSSVCTSVHTVAPPPGRRLGLC